MLNVCACPTMSHPQVLRDSSTSNHSQSKERVALVDRQTDLFPHIYNQLLSDPSSSLLICSACLSAPGTITAKKWKSYLSLFDYIPCIRLRQERWWEWTKGDMQYKNKHVCLCTVGLGLGGFSATGWAYPENLLCFKRTRERSDSNRVCHTHTHTQARTLSALPTAECMSTPGTKSALQ